MSLARAFTVADLNLASCFTMLNMINPDMSAYPRPPALARGVLREARLSEVAAGPAAALR